MKVLFAHDSYFFNDNTDQYYSEHIDNSILERYLHLGSHVTFLVRCEKMINLENIENKYSALNKQKCSVICTPNIKTLKGLKNINKLKEEVKKAVLSHDIVVTRLSSTLGSMAVKYSLKYNKPLLGEIVGCTWDGLWNYSLKGKILAPYYFYKQRKAVRQLPYAIYVTSEFLQKRYPTKGKSVNCSNVVLDDLDEAILKKRLLKISKLKNNDSINIGTIAGIDVPFKGQKFVLMAMSKLKKKNLLYKVVGKGTGKILTQIAKKLDIENQFKVVGPIKHAAVFDFLDNLDLYIQPSKQEGLPRALIEAMSRGLPAIGSRTGGIPELLKEEFIFDKGSVRQLSNIIENFDLKKMAKESEINFQKSKEYYINNINKKRYDFYFEFLQENKLPIPKLLLKSLDKLDKKVKSIS